MNKLILSILDTLDIRHTSAFVREMCTGNLQGNNLFGIMRLLEVFGVKSDAVRLDDGQDFKDLDLPYIASLGKDSIIMVTHQDDKELTYTDGKAEIKTDWASFLDKADMLAVMLSASDNASEPGYKKHRNKEIYRKCLWAIPLVWIVWLIIMQFCTNPCRISELPPPAFRISGSILSAIGLFFSILLHRQWTGDGNAVEKICSHFKTSKCSSAHDTFFFNKWFDLSEVGASYFLAILLIILVTPEKSWSVAWMILPALPASLWNLGYQFFKQKHWCPICVAVQALFWITAAAFLLCGAYRIPETFFLLDIVGALLLWGSLLVLILKAVTPAIINRHASEASMAALSTLKGNKSVVEAILGKLGPGVRNITIAVSPTCPYCKPAVEKIEEILLPTGRFTLEIKYKSIHEGDKEKIEKLVGQEEAGKHDEWCKQFEVNATPTVFINGIKLNSIYSIEDLLYL